MIDSMNLAGAQGKKRRESEADGALSIADRTAHSRMSHYRQAPLPHHCDGLQLTRGGEYAMRAMIYLAVSSVWTEDLEPETRRRPA